MRTVVLGVLALAPGCNWVFGLDPVTLTDARQDDAPPDARLPTVKLSAITPMLNASGQTTGQATFVPITPAPTVQYGRRGEALVDTVYTGQDVPVGYEFAESDEIWRLVYTLEGGVPHEVHWRPSVAMHPGHAVVLQLTPNDRDAPPATGTFVLDATGAPASWYAPRLYTTNTWTLDPSPPPDTTILTRVSSNFTTAATKTIAGAKRKPDPVKDFEVLLDYDDSAAGNTCAIVTGSAAFRIDLSNGSSIDPTPPTFETYLANPKPGNYFLATPNGLDGVAVAANVAGANGLQPTEISRYQIVTYGPGGSIPLHHHSDLQPLLPSVPLPVPVGILLAKCKDGPNTVPPFGYPSRLTFPTLGTIMYATPALPLAGGGSVVNGLQTTIVGASTPSAGPFNADYTGAAFATAPTIDGVDVNITSGSVAAIPTGGPTAALNFDHSIPDPVIDLYEATLFRVDGSQLVRLRDFTFTEKPLQFDRAQGQPVGTRYVFAIRVIRGASASAANADFSVWGNTQWLGVTHTQAFTLD